MGDRMSELIAGKVTTESFELNGEAIGTGVGTGANDLVKLDGSARLPAVDASLLTNLPVEESVGSNQTWQNVLGSRSSGVTYQNTTGRPIMVSIYGDGNIPSVEVSSDGSTWILIQDGGSNSRAACTIIVPDTWRYRSTGTLTRWVELR